MSEIRDSEKWQEQATDKTVESPDYQVEITKPSGEKLMLTQLDKNAMGLTGSWALLVSGIAIGEEGELGSLLMKNFFHALLSEEFPPMAVVFINKGVQLACVDSPILDCLNALSSRGTFICSCRTSLESHKLRMQLCAGKIANMYSIIETLTAASRVITL